MCPNNDNVTLQWLYGDSMQTLNGSVTRSNTSIETKVVTDINVDNYLCKLESDLYPDVQLNCSISNAKSTTTFHTFDNVMMSSRPDDVTTMKLALHTSMTSITIQPETPNANDTDSISSSTTISETTTPVTFTLNQLIIAGSAAAGGVLFLIALLCLVIACCKRGKNSDNVADAENEMHKRSTQPLSTVTETTSPTPNYFVIEQPLHQSESPRKGSMPAYAKPNKSGAKKDAQEYDAMDTNRTPLSTSNDLTNENDMLTDQYASIYDIEEDRDKVSTPTNLSPHDYAYASFDLTTAATLGSTAPSTHSDVKEESKTGRDGEEGFVENSIYDPMV